MEHRKIKRLRGRIPGAIIVALVMMTCAFSVYSQNAGEAFVNAEPNQSTSGNSSFALRRGDTEFGGFGGTSLNTPSMMGTVEDARLTLIGIRYGRILGTLRKAALEYTVDALPVVVVSQPQFVARQIAPGAFRIERTHVSVYGVGVSPVGFKLNFLRDKRVQLFLSANGGVLYFTRQVPAPGSSQFNFTFAFGAGVQLLTPSRRAITVGYEWRHISNNDTADFNPGLDANMIYAGFSIFR